MVAFPFSNFAISKLQNYLLQIIIGEFCSVYNLVLIQTYSMFPYSRMYVYEYVKYEYVDRD